MKIDVNNQEHNILIELLENKIEDVERNLSLCEGLESKRYVTSIKVELINLNRILEKFKSM